MIDRSTIPSHQIGVGLTIDPNFVPRKSDSADLTYMGNRRAEAEWEDDRQAAMTAIRAASSVCVVAADSASG